MKATHEIQPNTYDIENEIFEALEKSEVDCDDTIALLNNVVEFFDDPKRWMHDYHDIDGVFIRNNDDVENWIVGELDLTFGLYGEDIEPRPWFASGLPFFEGLAIEIAIDGCSYVGISVGIYGKPRYGWYETSLEYISDLFSESWYLGDHCDYSHDCIFLSGDGVLHTEEFTAFHDEEGELVLTSQEGEQFQGGAAHDYILSSLSRECPFFVTEFDGEIMAFDEKGESYPYGAIFVNETAIEIPFDMYAKRGR